MADVTMPKMGFDMQEGTIVRWLKQVGDDVKKGEPIAEIETDKVTIEIEAFSSGKITQIVAGEGSVVPVGATIAVLDGDSAAAAADGGGVPAEQTGASQGAGGSGPGDVGAVQSGASTPDVEIGAVTASDAAQQTEQTPTVSPSSQPSGGARQSSSGGGQTSSGGSQPAPGYNADETAQEAATGQPQPTDAGRAPGGERMEPSSAQSDGGHVPASPVAKRLARENNVNITQVTGSGPGGRIVRRDVEQFVSSGAAQRATTPTSQPAQQAAAPAQAQPAAAPAQAQPAAQPAAQPTTAPSGMPAPAGAPVPGSRREPLSRLRQTIARRLVQSKAPVPHFYVTSEINMEAVADLRKQLNASGDVKITVNDMIVKAAAIAMKKFPVLNASFAEDSLDYHDYINVGIAVATDNGLLAPAVTDVDKKSLGTISAEAKELIGRTRTGKATPDELQRGTFSVSNLGMYPVDSFVAIINPPQAAIIAVGAATQQPVVRDGQIVVGQMMKATISVDHRVADGAVAAEYMQELKRLLETPMLILL